MILVVLLVNSMILVVLLVAISKSNAGGSGLDGTFWTSVYRV